MIDREARNKALELIRRVKEERLTNWELEDAWVIIEHAGDEVMNCIMQWFWVNYDDGKKVAMIDKLDTLQRKTLDRCEAFLKTDLALEVTDGSKRVFDSGWDCFDCRGCSLPFEDLNTETWPFTPEQYQSILKKEA